MKRECLRVELTSKFEIDWILPSDGQDTPLILEGKALITGPCPSPFCHIRSGRGLLEESWYLEYSSMSTMLESDDHFCPS